MQELHLQPVVVILTALDLVDLVWATVVADCSDGLAHTMLRPSWGH
jgi:hypothetical protein